MADLGAPGLSCQLLGGLPDTSTQRPQGATMMQDGDDRTDPRCARCHRPCTAPIVYRDGFWFHAQCFKAGARQLRHAMRLANALAAEAAVAFTSHQSDEARRDR